MSSEFFIKKSQCEFEFMEEKIFGKVQNLLDEL